MPNLAEQHKRLVLRYGCIYERRRLRVKTSGGDKESVMSQVRVLSSLKYVVRCFSKAGMTQADLKLRLSKWMNTFDALKILSLSEILIQK